MHTSERPAQQTSRNRLEAVQSARAFFKSRSEMLIARVLRRMKDRLGHSCPAAQILEDHGHERFVSGVRLDIEDLSVDETFGYKNLTVNPGEWEFLTVGSAYDEAPPSTNAQVDLADDHAILVTSSPPLHHVFSRGPDFEDQGAWRVEVASQHDFAIGRQGHRERRITWNNACGHESFPFPASPAGGLSAPPP